jgi:xylulokinase
LATADSAGPSLIGLDFGTGRIRAIAVDLGGHTLAEAALATPTRFPRPGWAEHDPGELWRTVCDVLKSLMQGLPSPRAIKGLAVASVGEAGVLIGRDGHELGPIIAWYCGRTVGEREALRAQLGDGYVFSRSGVTINHTFGLGKLSWWRRHYPDMLAKARYWLNMADWVAFRLTGEARTDFTLASRTNALDIKRRAWSEELLSKIGIDARLFAPLIASGAVVGRVHEKAAADTGLPRDTVIAAGGHDHVISSAAANTDEPGVLLDSMGTAEAQLLMNDAAVFDDGFRAGGYQQGLLIIDQPRNYLCCGLTTSGGAVEWFRRQTGGTAYETLIAAARDVPPGSNGVCFLPHLRGGDQPYPNPNTRAAFIGIGGDSSPGLLFRSVLEGVAMSAKLAVEGMTALQGVSRVHRIRVIGGGTRNDLWMKIKASVYGRALEVTPLDEGTGLSAAILAGLGSGLFASLREAREAMAGSLGRVTIVEPDPDWTERYDRLYRTVYSGLAPMLSPVHDSLAALRQADAPAPQDRSSPSE